MEEGEESQTKQMGEEIDVPTPEEEKENEPTIEQQNREIPETKASARNTEHEHAEEKEPEGFPAFAKRSSM